MAKKLHLKRSLLFIGLVAGLLLIPTSSVFAQTQDTNQGLEISPALINVSGDGGKAYTLDITVHNVTKYALDFSASVDDFGAKDETGQPSIILDPTDSLPTSIKTWVQSIPSFRLQSNETKHINVSMLIPPGAEPGGHYGVIRFTGRSPDATGSIGQVASAGTLVLVRVSGDIKETLELASLDITKDGKNGTIFESGPLTFVSRFKNTGSVHVKPVGHIEIRDAFGHSNVVPLNESEGNILPGSIRRFESPLNTTWMFGHYTADLSIAYGTTGQAIVRTISFWVIPYKLILLTLAVLLTLVYIIAKAIRRYNTYIITQSRKHK